MIEKTPLERITDDLTQAFNGHGLIFTPAAEVDVGKFESFMQAGNYAWVSHQGSSDDVDSYDPARQLAGMKKEAKAHGNQHNFLVQREVDGPYIGHLNVTISAQGTAMMSSYMVPSVRNLGVGTQMTQIVTQQLSANADSLGIHELMGRILENNGPSRRVAEKAGWSIDASRPRLGSYLDYVKELRQCDNARGGIA